VDHLDGVAQALGDVAFGLAVFEQQGGVGVPHVVEPDANDSGHSSAGRSKRLVVLWGSYGLPSRDEMAR